MRKLVKVETLRVAIGEMDVKDITDLLSSALDMVTTPIETILQTRFSRGDFVDVYYPQTPDPVVTARPYGLVLSSGLVDKLTPVVIKVAYAYDDLETAEVFTGASIIDYDRGLVQFPNGRPGNFIKISYTSGLPALVDEDDYEPEDVPYWLEQIAMSYAHSVYERLVWIRARDIKDIKKSKQAKDTLLNTPEDLIHLANKWVRWFPTAVQPSYTLEV